MKPILPYSILLSIAISPLASATTYGQISNKNTTYLGDVNIISGANSMWNSGSVEVGANYINTRLQGNVTITNTGGRSAICLTTNSGFTSYVNINNVTSDVNITTNGAGYGDGIYHYGFGYSNTSNITIDAGSDHDLNVYKTDSATATGGGIGVHAEQGGHINITAKNVNVDFTSTGTSTGLRAFGYNSGVNTTINITAEQVTAKSGYRGVEASYGGIINITGNLDASTTRIDGIGVLAQGGNHPSTVLTVGGHTTVSGIAKYGVQAWFKGTALLKGGLTVNQATLGATYAVFAEGGTVKDGIANGTGGTTYDVSGEMRAQTDAYATVGTIDLHMGAGSTFTGYTTEATAANTINLELSNGAQWTNTAASTMSNLSLLANSTIAFNEIGTSDAFYNINSAAVMLAEGSLLKVDLADTFTGDVTLFSGITTTTTTWNGGTDVENAILLNAAGTTKFIYTNPSAGVFRITGSVLVPEPTTASLTLLGLAALMMRRRRVTV